MNESREMTLREWCAKLPTSHLVNRQLAAIDELIAAATASRAARKAFEADECIGLLDAVRCADDRLAAALTAVGGEGQG